MLQRIKSLQDVVDWGLCLGCGACSYFCERDAVQLVDVHSQGIRPILGDACHGCRRCLAICPGYSADANLAAGPRQNVSETEREIGPTLEIWEGYATDPEVRFRGSSGGLLTALSLFCLEQQSMAFVLHTGMDEQQPWMNKTVISRGRAELLSRTGSRYSPASPCERLADIENSDRPCVFVGKPSDTMAVWKTRQHRPQLDRNLGLVLTFFCAGEPNTTGTLSLLEMFGVQRDDLASLNYRGEGWPGNFRVRSKSSETTPSMTYRESWGKLTGFRAFRWQLDPDGLGTVADLSCGDAWQDFRDGDDGRSLVLVRTARGRDILHAAMKAGYVTLRQVGPEAVLKAQANLLNRRKEIFGRCLGMRLLGVPVPKLHNFSLFHSWIRLPLTRQVRTVFGTAWRVLKRQLWRPHPIVEEQFTARFLTQDSCTLKSTTQPVSNGIVGS